MLKEGRFLNNPSYEMERIIGITKYLVLFLSFLAIVLFFIFDLGFIEKYLNIPCQITGIGAFLYLVVEHFHKQAMYHADFSESICQEDPEADDMIWELEKAEAKKESLISEIENKGNELKEGPGSNIVVKWVKKNLLEFLGIISLILIISSLIYIFFGKGKSLKSNPK